MSQRFVFIWFRHLLADWLSRKQPDLKDLPFVLTSKVGNRLMIMSANEVAENEGVYTGMLFADARAILPTLENFDYKDGVADKLLDVIGDWCVRYTPSVSISSPDGLFLDITGCAHLRGGERPYLKDLVIKLREFGYDARAALADTPGTAWAVAKYGESPIVEIGKSESVLSRLPPEALRLDDDTAQRLNKIGIRKIAELMKLPRPSLNRRFGQRLCLRLDQALGISQEKLLFKKYIDPYIEDLMIPETVSTAEGIAKALGILLDRLCHRLHEEQRCVRNISFEGFRVDGKIEQVEIGTARGTRSAKHLFKLFSEKLGRIEPALGIEQFRLSAGEVEDMPVSQDEMLEMPSGLNNTGVEELVDRLTTKFTPSRINRYLPQERHWPERSIKATRSMSETTEANWVANLRPVRMLSRPEPIDVTAPVPDYPPMMFRYKGELHKVRKADGPERIEREWWMENGRPRDYFRLEDEKGQRYWVFRSGHYEHGQPSLWFMHGFFA